MNYSKFVEDLQAEFYIVLEAKTNWGRNDLKMAFERAIVRVLSRWLEKQANELFIKKEKDADTKQNS